MAASALPQVAFSFPSSRAVSLPLFLFISSPSVVLATDIMDKDLGALRKARWDKAFHSGSDRLFKKSSRKQEDVHRKATIVLEHMIQASDVSHTMQHWHVYRRWNERFFHEMYTAYSQGRLDKDPSQNWYKGELGFFDFYIIPLAKKLKECGVFGVSSAEYLNYAMANREEWRLEGEEVVRQYVAKYVQSPDQVDADAAVDVPYSDRVDV